jgi:hypothetical protein
MTVGDSVRTFRIIVQGGPLGLTPNDDDGNYITVNNWSASRCSNIFYAKCKLNLYEFANRDHQLRLMKISTTSLSAKFHSVRWHSGP